VKVLLYLEGEKVLSKSGIGRAISHQKRALDLVDCEYTTDIHDDYDIVHINTYGPKSYLLLKKAKKAGKKVIYHGHSTREDFANSFIGSNLLAPVVGKYLTYLYSQADMVITPTEYSKSLIEGYGVKCPVLPISNGIDLAKYQVDEDKELKFKEYFDIKDSEAVVICAGLYFKRKGIEDFIQVAREMPDVRFIWFGYTDMWTIPSDVRKLVKKDHPANVEFPGYIKGDIFEGAMSAGDIFFFPSYEETEGIVVLEALASHQNVVIRDIPVFDGWIDKTQAIKGKNVGEFKQAISDILSGKLDFHQKGYKVAQSRSIEKIAHQLVDAYEQVLKL